jgi:membrane-associated phospholipid phosphatase
VNSNDAPAPTLPAPLRLPIGVAAMLAALVLAALGAVYAADATIGGFDGRAAPLDSVRPSLLDAALMIDFGGEPVSAVILLAALMTACLVLQGPRMAVFAVVAPLLTVAVTTALKPVVGRTIHGNYLAFPSGHTALATALALVVALLAVNRFWPGTLSAVLFVLAAAVTFGAVMAWSQIVLSRHYPTDTLGGFCAALVVVPATAWLFDRTAKPR